MFLGWYFKSENCRGHCGQKNLDKFFLFAKSWGLILEKIFRKYQRQVLLGMILESINLYTVISLSKYFIVFLTIFYVFQSWHTFKSFLRPV